MRIFLNKGMFKKTLGDVETNIPATIISKAGVKLSIECIDNEIAKLKEDNHRSGYSADRSMAVHILDAFRTSLYDSLRGGEE